MPLGRSSSLVGVTPDERYASTVWLSGERLHKGKQSLCWSALPVTAALLM